MAGRDWAAATSFTYHGGDLAFARRLFPARRAVDRPFDRRQSARLSVARSCARVWARLPEQRSARRARGRRRRRATARRREVVAGPGSQAVIHTLARLVPRGASACWATYFGHAAAWRRGRRRSTKRARSRTSAVRRRHRRQSNNPDGRLVPRRLSIFTRRARRAACWSSTRHSPTSTARGRASRRFCRRAARSCCARSARLMAWPGCGSASRSPRPNRRSASRGARPMAGQRPGDRDRRARARRFRTGLEATRSRSARRAARLDALLHKRRLADRRRNAALRGGARRCASRSAVLQASARRRHPHAPLRGRPRSAAVWRSSRRGGVASGSRRRFERLVAP